MAEKRLGIKIITSFDGKGSKQAKKEVTGLNKALGNLGKISAAVGGTGLLLKLGKDAIQTASDIQEMRSKFDTVFGSNADSVTSQLQNFADQANRSVYDLQGFAASFQDTFVPLGFARDDASKLSVQLTKLTEDLASFNNVASEDVAANLSSALVGNHEAVRSFGIIITESTLKAELAANGWDKLTGSALEQAKVQARLNIIMRSTTDAQGDAVRTADSFANQMRGLEASWQEFSGTLGTLALPAVTAVVQGLNDLTKGAAEGLKAIQDGQAAVDEVTESNFKAAESSGDWQTQAQKLTKVLEDNKDVLFLMFGRGRVLDEIKKVAAATGDFSGDNERLAQSLSTVFGAQVEVRQGMVFFNGTQLETLDNLRQMNEEYRATVVEAGGVGHAQEQLTEQMERYRAQLDRTQSAQNAHVAELSDTESELRKNMAAASEAAFANSDLADKVQQQGNKMSADEAMVRANNAAIQANAEAARAAAAAQEELTRKVQGYFLAALEGQDGAWLFNESIEQLGHQTVLISGRTSEQQRILEDLRDEYDKAEKTISDYQYGVAGLGLTEEERNEKIQQQIERMAELEAAMQPLVSIQGEYAERNVTATVNQDALNQAIFDSAVSAGASAEELALLGTSLGLYSDEAAEAALKSAIIRAKIDELTAGWDGTKEGLEEVRSELQSFIDELNGIPPTVSTTVTTNYVSSGQPPAHTTGGVPTGSSEGGATYRASGGAVFPGQDYIVGERGPEYFRTSSPGTILPHNLLGNGVGGNTTIQIYQQPGESAEMLAERVSTILARRTRQVRMGRGR